MTWTPWTGDVEADAEYLAAVQRSAEERAARPAVEQAVIQDVDIEGNTATVTLLSEPFPTFTGISCSKSGVVPTPGRAVWLWRNGDELVLLAPIDGTMSIGAEFKSPDYVPGISGWAIFADGSVEFNDGRFRGNLTLGSTELFANTGFESGLSPWTAANGTLTRVNSPTNSGSWAAQINNTGNYATAKSEQIPAVEDDVIWAKIHRNVAAGSGDRFAYINIRFYDDTDDELEDNPVFIPVNTRSVYDDESAAAKAPADTAYAVVELGGWRPTSGAITVFVDDLMCRRASRVQGAYLEEAFADKFVVGERLTTNRITYKRAGVDVARISNQFIPAGTMTAVVWNSEENDVPYGNMWTSGANVTIREDGLYTASGGCTWSVTPDSFGGATAIDMAGIPWTYRNTLDPIVNTAAHGTQWMKAGQTIRMLVYHGSGSNVTAFMTVNRVVTG